MTINKKTIEVMRRTGAALKYGAGMLTWLIVLNVLAMHTRLNVWSLMDGMWMRDLHDGLVRNMAGDLAFRADYGYGDFGSGAKYIYLVGYRPDSEGKGGKSMTLTSLVDTATWHQAGRDGIITVFRDARHEYRVRSISDGTDILVDTKE
jgi:hypothetical protein